MKMSRHEKAIRSELEEAKSAIGRIGAKITALQRELSEEHGRAAMLERLLEAPEAPGEPSDKGDTDGNQD